MEIEKIEDSLEETLQETIPDSLIDIAGNILIRSEIVGIGPIYVVAATSPFGLAARSRKYEFSVFLRSSEIKIVSNSFSELDGTLEKAKAYIKQYTVIRKAVMDLLTRRL